MVRFCVSLVMMLTLAVAAGDVAEVEEAAAEAVVGPLVVRSKPTPFMVH